MERAVQNGTEVADKEFVVLTELLMVQLLKLDAIEADGEAKVQRRIEVCSCCSFLSLRDEMAFLMTTSVFFLLILFTKHSKKF